MSSCASINLYGKRRHFIWIDTGNECKAVAGRSNNDLVRTLFTRVFGIQNTSTYFEHVRFGDLNRSFVITVNPRVVCACGCKCELDECRTLFQVRTLFTRVFGIRSKTLQFFEHARFGDLNRSFVITVNPRVVCGCGCKCELDECRTLFLVRTLFTRVFGIRSKTLLLI